MNVTFAPIVSDDAGGCIEGGKIEHNIKSGQHFKHLINLNYSLWFSGKETYEEI